jgi:flagellar biosynthesis/type III secretory pathway protein FliH
VGFHRTNPNAAKAFRQDEKTHEEILLEMAAAHTVALLTAHDNGRRQGYEACQAEIKQSAADSINAVAEALQGEIKNFDAPFALLAERLADMTVKMALRIARRMVDYEIERRPERIIDALASVLQGVTEAAAPDQVVELEVHHDDAQYLDAIPGITLKTTSEIKRGGAIARIKKADPGAHGAVAEWDARIESRWQEIEAALGEVNAAS